jgi:ankyrin repeat protein
MVPRQISRLIVASIALLSATPPVADLSEGRLVAIVSSDDPQALWQAIGPGGMQRVVSFDQEERADILCVAAFRGSARIVSALLEAGANVDGEPAISNGDNLKRHTPLYLAASQGRTDIVRVLLAAGANTTLSDRAGFGPLHIAAALDRQGPVQLLLDAGVPINLRASRGDTALKLAVMRSERTTAKYLLQRGADPGVADSRGDTALHEAARNDDVETVQLLLASGARESPNRYGRTPRQEASFWSPNAIAVLNRSVESR